MKAPALFTPLILGAVALAVQGAEVKKEEKQKLPNMVDYPFWKSEKRGDVTQFVPGLNAALELTPAQEEQIAAARTESMNDEALKAFRGLSKSDPSVTDEQRQKARAAVEAANVKLRERVTKILTPQQAELLAKVNAAYLATVEEIGTVYSEKFASVKGDEAARKRIQEEKSQDVEDHFLGKLDGILSPAQKDAMTKAAQEEQRRGAQATVKKPSK